MAKVRVGSKRQSYWNGEWVGHGRKFGKQLANRIQRRFYRLHIKKALKHHDPDVIINKVV